MAGAAINAILGVYRFKMPQAYPDLRVHGLVHAAQWYLLITGPSSLRLTAPHRRVKRCYDQLIMKLICR
jgi:hypothetical protein